MLFRCLRGECLCFSWRPSSMFIVNIFCWDVGAGVILCSGFLYWGYAATRYDVAVPGFEGRWGWDFPYPSRLTARPIQPPVPWVPGLCRRYGVRRVASTTHPPLASRLRMGKTMPLLPGKCLYSMLWMNC